MIRIGAIAALAALAAGFVYAQVQTIEPVVPRALPEQRVEPLGELPPPVTVSPAPVSPVTVQPVTVPPRLVMNAERARRDADARHCLTLVTNREVHRCAEPYRSRASRSAVARASAKRTTVAAPPRVEIPRRADTLKPGAPRPDDAAKAADLVKPMDVTRPGAVPRPIESATRDQAPPKSSAAAPGTESKLPAPLMKPSESRPAK